jgi:nitrite reductase/ring-hydroxylating ferredoxin subunit
MAGAARPRMAPAHLRRAAAPHPRPAAAALPSTLAAAAAAPRHCPTARQFRRTRLFSAASETVEAATAAAAPAATATTTSPAAAPSRDAAFSWHQQWWPIAVVSQLNDKNPTAAMLLGIPLVIWKDGSGAWSVLEDRCPHRLAPLSEGRVEPSDGTLQCVYHGWRFDAAGEWWVFSGWRGWLGCGCMLAGCVWKRPAASAGVGCSSRSRLRLKDGLMQTPHLPNPPQQGDPSDRKRQGAGDRLLLGARVRQVVPLSGAARLRATCCVRCVRCLLCVCCVSCVLQSTIQPNQSNPIQTARPRPACCGSGPTPPRRRRPTRPPRFQRSWAGRGGRCSEGTGSAGTWNTGGCG